MQMAHALVAKPRHRCSGIGASALPVGRERGGGDVTRRGLTKVTRASCAPIVGCTSYRQESYDGRSGRTSGKGLYGWDDTQREHRQNPASASRRSLVGVAVPDPQDARLMDASVLRLNRPVPPSRAVLLPAIRSYQPPSVRPKQLLCGAVNVFNGLRMNA